MNYKDLITQRKTERAREFLVNSMYLLENAPEAIEFIKEAIRKIDEQKTTSKMGLVNAEEKR